MRIHIKTTPSKKVVDFNHLHLLTGTVHKWFGENDFHEGISLYSFSNLTGAKSSKKGLEFPDGALFFISCWNNEQLKCLVKGIQESSEMFAGMAATEIVIQENPDLSARSRFALGSPVYIQRNTQSGNKKFFFYNDEESPELLRQTLFTKMRVAGLPEDETLDISFDQSYPRKGTKKYDYKRGSTITQIRSSWCPVIIEAKPTTKVFAWNVGLGNSTGIGFGAIK